MIPAIVNCVLALALAPLLGGVISRVKARIAGRVGPPLLQPYYELAKLLLKGVVYSHTSTWIFRAAPLISVAAVGGAVLLMPVGSGRGVVSFGGDVIVFVYLMGLARMLTVLAALDTGSSFEGMGASREMLLAALSEPALLVALAVVARHTPESSLAQLCAMARGAAWTAQWPAVALVCAVLCVIMLAETARVPVDDPATHLELTMIHEVMVLDHSGPDLALMSYAHALKLWVLSALCINMIVPAGGVAWRGALAAWAGIFVLAGAIGMVESCMARWRLVKLPQLLAGAGALALLALIFDLWRY